MKFTLSESLFDDNFNVTDAIGEIATEGDFDSYIDDDFTNSGSIDSKVDIPIPEGPQPGPNTGVADMLIAAINDEWEAIQTYNSIISTLTYESNNNEQFSNMIPVIQDIVNEENKHVGQLQEILKVISPNTESIRDGEIEARGQFEFINGKLKIEAHEPQNRYYSGEPTNSNDISTICYLNDTDDEF